MKKLLLPILLVAACATVPGSIEVATPPSQTTSPTDPGKATISEATQCGDLVPVAQHFVHMLKMQDWEVKLFCIEIPDEQKAWAFSIPDTDRKKIDIVIDPRGPDFGMALLHEILHGFIQEVSDANSDLINEQSVRTLARALLGRPAKGEW